MKGIGRMLLLAFVLTVVLFAYFQPATQQKPEPSPARQPEQRAAAQSPPVAPKKAEPKVDKSAAAQERRSKLIAKLQAERVFLKIEVPGNLPRLWVTQRFKALDFDTKQTFVSVVYAYYFDGNDFTDSVRIYDGQSGKEIGQFTTSGLRMF
jgi:hypothetical protein